MIEAIRRFRAELDIFEAAVAGKSQLEAFLDANYVKANDPYIGFADFWVQFQAFLPKHERAHWPKAVVRAELPEPFRLDQDGNREIIRHIKRKQK